MKPCIYCQNQEFKTIFHNAQLHIVQCVNCGLVRQADYALTLATINQAFDNPNAYYEKRSHEKDSQIAYSDAKLQRTADIRAFILNQLQPHALLLDVGSGRGEFASALQKQGLSVMGLEPDPIFAEFSKKNLGLDVQTGSYERNSFASNYFDAITFIQVMEHVENPWETLQAAYAHLKPGGLLVVDVPSFHNPRVYLYRLTNQSHWVKSDFIISHNHYFTRKTLSQLAEKVGFSLLRVDTGRYVVKFGHRYPMLRPVLWAVDKLTNQMGIGGITLYAIKPFSE